MDGINSSTATYERAAATCNCKKMNKLLLSVSSRRVTFLVPRLTVTEAHPFSTDRTSSCCPVGKTAGATGAPCRARRAADDTPPAPAHARNGLERGVMGMACAPCPTAASCDPPSPPPPAAASSYPSQWRNRPHLPALLAHSSQPWPKPEASQQPADAAAAATASTRPAAASTSTPTPFDVQKQLITATGLSGAEKNAIGMSNGARIGPERRAGGRPGTRRSWVYTCTPSDTYVVDVTRTRTRRNYCDALSLCLPRPSSMHHPTLTGPRFNAPRRL